MEGYQTPTFLPAWPDQMRETLVSRWLWSISQAWSFPFSWKENLFLSSPKILVGHTNYKPCPIFVLSYWGILYQNSEHGPHRWEAPVRQTNLWVLFLISNISLCLSAVRLLSSELVDNSLSCGNQGICIFLWNIPATLGSNSIDERFEQIDSRCIVVFVEVIDDP